jgi:quercetin dioxygenase-like cupin family protein
MQHWHLPDIDAPRGKRDPVVVYEDDGARAVLVVLQPLEELGDHQVRESAWVVVVEGVVSVVAGGGEPVEGGPGTLFRFEPGERHTLAARTGARILILLAPWPGEGHFPA